MRRDSRKAHRAQPQRTQSEDEADGLDTDLDLLTPMESVAPGLPPWQPDCEPPPSMRLPSRLGRYSIVRRIGRGGMGVVYEAWDPERALRVALKTMRHIDSRALSLLKREFRSMADVIHPNLASLYELSTEGEVWFFTMELVEGRDILASVGDPHHGGPDLPALRDALRQLALGLGALHEQGLSHQDIKPSNVLVEPSGRLVLLDFGLVSRAGSAVDEWGVPTANWGTRAFFAPERLQGSPVSASDDWFAVGVVLYRILTGSLPSRVPSSEAGFPGEIDFGKIALDAAPADLAALCLRLLAREPERRPSFRQVLEALGHDEVVVARPKRTSDGGGVFVGRRSELDRLHAAADTAASGQTTLALLRGSIGMGKTALLRRFAAERAGPSTVVLSGRCYERESVPYKGIDELVDALAQWLSKRDPLERAELLPKDLEHLATMFPVLRRVPGFPSGAPRQEDSGDLEAVEQRRRALTALRILLDRLATANPTVLILDDMHWGDEESAVLLGLLLSGSTPPPLLVVVAYRDEAPSPFVRSFGARLGELAGVQRVDLEVGPLAAEEAEELAASLLEDEAAPSAPRIAEEAGRSPFWIEQLAHPEAVRGAEGLEAVVRARVEALVPDARRLLEVISLSSRPIPLEVAYEAAVLDRDPRGVLADLRARHLARTERHDDLRVNVYHDAIRRTVVTQLDAAQARAHHGRLAAALEGAAKPDAEVIAWHHHAAGDRAKAAHHAVIAALQAESALAFGHAAELYAFARRCSDEDDMALFSAQASALAHAGRSKAAADLYAQAAAIAPGAGRLDFQRQAAEEYLLSGHVARGIEALLPVLRHAGLRYAPAPWLSMASTLKNLAVLYAKGTNFTPRPSEQIPPELRRQLEICFSAGKGLASYDPVRGSEYIVKGTLLALRAGDAAYVARGLSYVGLMLVYGGERMARQGQALVAAADRIALESGSDAALGWVGVVRGLASTSVGSWRIGVDEIDEAVALLRARTVGTWWERSVGLTTSLLALSKMGSFRRMRSRAEQLVRSADTLGDRFTGIEARLYLALASLAADEPRQARRRLVDAMSDWTQEAYHFQHWTGHRHQTLADLYEGPSRLTFDQIERHARRAKRAGLFDNQIVRIEAWWLRGVCALALGGAGALRPVVEEAVERLLAERRGWSRALSLALRAGLADRDGETQKAAELYRKTRTAFQEADMELHAASAALRLAALLGDRRGKALRESAIRTMRAAEIAEPARWARIIVPAV